VAAVGDDEESCTNESHEEELEGHESHVGHEGYEESNGSLQDWPLL